MKSSFIFRAVFLMALATITLARSHSSLEHFKRELEGGDDGKILKSIEVETIEFGEELAKDIVEEKLHESDGNILVCAFELLEDIGHFFKNAFKEGGEDGDEKDGDDDDDDGDNDDDGKDDDDDDENFPGYEGDEVGPIPTDEPSKNRSSNGTFGPTRNPSGLGTHVSSNHPSGQGTDGPSNHPSRGTRGPSHHPSHGTHGPSNQPSRGTHGPSHHPSRGGTLLPSFGPSGRPKKCHGAMEKFVKCMKKAKGKGGKEKEGHERGDLDKSVDES